jgi:glyoxylase-like metal-dependent hydrolase (beta-lactamase superfamily II)
MTEFRLTRRRLLFTAGSGVLGVTVLNSVAACSSSSSSSSPPTTAPASAAPAGGAAGDWRRVSLDFVSAYLLVRGSEVAVVDLGTPGSATAIETGLKAAGQDWGAVQHVILTHQHQDHAGGLADVAPLVGAKIYAGQADVSAIDSAKPLQAVKDGDEVFGLQIIGTPGHTAGHVCVFDPASGTLVAGDALRTQNGLEGSDPQYTADPAAAAESLRKLAQLNIKAILPGHGEPLTSGAAEALQKLAAGR